MYTAQLASTFAENKTNIMTKFNNYLSFILQKRRVLIYGFLVFVVMWIFVDFTNDKPIDLNHPTNFEDLNWWAKWADPIVGMGTFLLALLIGLLQFRDDWEESLEKRLTVIFKYQDREVMVCKKAHLTAEGDIRQLGQQIGGQMSNSRLKFKANSIVSQRLGVAPNEFQKGKFILHYQVEFELTELPNNTFQSMNLIWHEPDNTNLDKLEEWINLVDDSASTEKNDI